MKRGSIKSFTLALGALVYSSQSFATLDSAANVGTGAGVFQSSTLTTFNFRTLVAGTNITVTQNTNDVTIATTAEANTASNLGSGAGLFTTKSGVNLPFKSLTAGSNITLTQNANDINIAATGTGESNTASNLGSGAGLFTTKSGVDLPFKSLTSGIGIELTENSNDVNIKVVATDTTLTTSFSGFDVSSVTFDIENIDKLVIMHIPAFSGSLTSSESGLASINTITSSLRPTQNINTLVIMDINGSRYANLATVDTSGVVTLYMGLFPFNWASGTTVSVLPFSIFWHL